MIPKGDRSMYSSISAAIMSVGTFSVPKVSTSTETGLATPIAYATWISHFVASPAATAFFAAQRAPYAALRSTFDGSFPLNAPPPWRAYPPYVSTMILRPVSPASAIGPPMTKRPVGLT